MRQAIESTEKAEKEGLLNGKSKVQFCKEYLYHMDEYQDLFYEFGNLEECLRMIDEIDEHYGEG